MNILDKAITAVAPTWGVRRAAARAAVQEYQRIYAAAATGRRGKSWSGRSTSANVEVSRSIKTLRDRSREFVRDSWAGQRMLDVLTSHVVGTGIQIVPNTGGDRTDNKIKSILAQWSENADVEGFLDWPGMQALAVRSMIEGGETVVRHINVTRDAAAGTVPLRLLGLEGDQIDGSRDRMSRDDGTRLGVKLGDWGRREGLYLFEDHPGEMVFTSAQSSLVDWKDLSHVFRPLRFGQIRGVPWFSAILLNAREVQDLVDAVLVKARTEACFAAFISRPANGGPSPFAKVSAENEKGDKITRIEPGMITDVGEGQVNFANPSSQTAFGEVYMTAMQAMAAGAGITYDQLTGDLRQANYSSLRAGKIEFRRLVEQIQWTVLVPQLIAPVGKKLISRAVLNGQLADRAAGYRLDYVMPAIEPIDPKKDLEADILAVRAGRQSPQEFISAWGRDWREVVEDTASFWEFFDKQGGDLGLGLDIDPRKPMKGSANANGDVKPQDA